MKKKIKLFIHPGFGNSGTTFLQQKIFSSSGFINLSKPRKREDELLKLQYKVFLPKYSFDKFYPFNFTSHIKSYVYALKKSINESDNNNFILSDECIFDRTNYFGYLNIYLLKEVIDILKKDFEIQMKFIITIRRQWELIYTSWSRSWRFRRNFGSFKNFINHLIKDQNLSEIYNFDLLLEKIKQIYNCDVLVLPLEELNINKKMYIKKIETFLETEIKNQDFDPINKNSFHDGGEKKFNINKPDVRRLLVEPISKIHFFMLRRFTYYEKNFYRFRFLKKYLFPKARKVGIMTIDDNQKQNLQKLFLQSNKNLEQISNLSLKSYDYY